MDGGLWGICRSGNRVKTQRDCFPPFVKYRANTDQIQSKYKVKTQRDCIAPFVKYKENKDQIQRKYKVMTQRDCFPIPHLWNTEQAFAIQGIPCPPIHSVFFRLNNSKELLEFCSQCPVRLFFSCLRWKKSIRNIVGRNCSWSFLETAGVHSEGSGVISY